MRRKKSHRTATAMSLADINEIGEVLDDLPETHDTSVGASLSAGDVDARWDQAESSGEETAGGSVPTPDQDVVDEIGRAIGITYDEGEPLRVGRKEEERDEHRWELDPASAEDYRERGAILARPADAIRHMRHRNRHAK